MLRDITLGQYYQADSVLHRMDSRVKLIGTMVYMVSLFIYKNVTAYALALLFLIAVIKISKVPFRFMVKGLKSVGVLLFITSIFNLFLTTGEPLVVLWKLTITREGLQNAIYIIIRLAFLIIGSSMMTLTTTPNQLTDGLEKLMGPMNAFRVPVHEVAMMMSIALRFIPILMEETDKIMKAQMARGANFESGKLIEKVKAMVPLLVPLFISAFRRANDLAMAMEARCYQGGEGRTRMKPLKYQRRDYAAFGALCIYLASVVVLGKLFPVNFL